MELKSNKELNRHFEKLKRLRKLREKEADNTYHYWEKEIAGCEHNIVEVVEEMLKKQTPIKVIVNEAYYSCPVCGTIRSIKQKHNFCHDCGQALDWEE